MLDRVRELLPVYAAVTIGAGALALFLAWVLT